MSKRLTPDERMDREMKKLKDLGITITRNPPLSGNPTAEFDVIEQAARRHGIYEEKGN